MHSSVMVTNMSVWTQSVHCDVYLQWMLFHLWVLVPTFQLFDMVGHDHAMLNVPLRGTAVYFYHTEVLFSVTNAVPFLQNSIAEQDHQHNYSGMWNACALLSIYPHLIVTVTVHAMCFQIYRMTPKNGNFWKTPTKIEEIQEKKIDRKWTILHSMQHTQGDTKERELLKCVVAVEECICGGGRHLQDVIFKQW